MINRLLIQAVAVGLSLAGCAGASGGAGGGFGSSSQVVVNMDGDPGDIAGATVTADRECASRGARARFILLQPTSSGGSQGGYTLRPPAAIFACDPVAAATAPRR